MLKLRIFIPKEAGGGVIEVVSSQRWVIEQIHDFFLSYVSGEKKGGVVYSIHIEVNPSITEKFTEIKDEEVVELYGRNGFAGYSGGRKVIQDNTSFKCFCDEGGGEFVLEAVDQQAAYREGRCLIRACVESMLFSRGFVLFHGAIAVAPSGQGVMIVGEKGSGKTSTLISLLANGFRYLENDRAFIGIAGGNLMALPRPAFFRVGAETYKRSQILQNCNGWSFIDEQGKMVFEQFLAKTMIPFLPISCVNAVVVADIFDVKKMINKDELIQNSILSDFPGLVAIRRYFYDCDWGNPSGTRVVLKKLQDLPVFVQKGTNFDDVIRFLKIIEA